MNNTLQARSDDHVTHPGHHLEELLNALTHGVGAVVALAAGAVLITTINALAVGFLLFPGGSRLKLLSTDMGLHSPGWPVIAIVTFLLLGTMVLMWKVAGGKGKLLKGGVVSGHSAVGFFLATTIMFMSANKAIGILAFLLAVLVAQSRVEGQIHTLQDAAVDANCVDRGPRLYSSQLDSHAQQPNG